MIVAATQQLGSGTQYARATVVVIISLDQQGTTSTTCGGFVMMMTTCDRIPVPLHPLIIAFLYCPPLIRS
jgi:hypothetical protein